MALTTLRNFDDWLSDPFFTPLVPFSNKTRTRMPNMSLDMRETDNEYKIEVDLPGVNRENIKLSTENGQLHISAERSNNRQSKEGERYYFSERSYGVVSRIVPLPEDANHEDIQARHENGVLMITLTKDENKKSRTITIQ